MADVFISYARKEIARAEIIKTALEARGLDVFFDIEGLDGGDVFPDILDREVKTCGVVLGLWSPYALSRPWVKIECRIGLDREVLVPATIEPVPSLDMPASFYNLHCIDLTDFDGQADHQGMKALWRVLARRLKRPDLMDDPNAPVPDAALARAKAAIAFIPASDWQRKSSSEILPQLLRNCTMTDLQALAESGDACAQLLVGFGYYLGEGGLPTNKVLALQLCKLAADQGYAPAQTNLGYMYSEGEGGLPVNKLEAVRLYRLAADQGDAGAQVNLGVMYYKGEGGLAINKAEAARLYQLAADQSLTTAQTNLGNMYAMGEGGLEQDRDKANELYRQAAKGGNA